MTSRLRPDREPDDPKPIVKIKTSPDKERQQEDDQQHPMTHPPVQTTSHRKNPRFPHGTWPTLSL